MSVTLLILGAIMAGFGVAHAGPEQLAVSIYATAGDVQSHLATPESRATVLPLLGRLNVARVFLEGRRGDEHVDPATLTMVRDFLEARQIRCSGGIATVPGTTFGTRQTGGLDWLDWESDKTRHDIAAFFKENAKVFDELILDDFFCTGDVSAHAERARAGRSWPTYRRDLLVSLIDPLVARPVRAARQNAKLIIKFPQWYDRFHLFGYDPERMVGRFDEVWVGTEVRNPRTRRMGFVQPTQGYMNYMWIKSIAGPKTRGAWFDHIECNAFNFIDQAYMSVLAGARELTLFRLGDVASWHPGDALLPERLPQLIELAKCVQSAEARGVFFYKPPNSDADDNLFIADYLGVMGLPIVPVASYPDESRVVVLAAHAACDPQIQRRAQRHLAKGATLILTPSFLRKAGSWAQELAGAVSFGQTGCGRLGEAASAESSALVEIDSSLRATTGDALFEVHCESVSVPLLTHRRAGRGEVLVLNMRTFSDTDYRGTGEWLLPPRELGWSTIPQRFLDLLRARLLKPLGLRLEAPAGVIMSVRGNARFLYNSTDQQAAVRHGGKGFAIGPHQVLILR